MVFVSNNVLLSQNISGEVEYEISSWECKYCRLPGKKKVVKSILKVSDYRYLHQLFFAAEKEEAEFGCVKYSWNHCSLSTNVNEVHSIIEIDVPVTEKKSFDRISKDFNFWVNISDLEEVSKKINADFIKWKKFYDQEQEKKNYEINKQEKKEKEQFDTEFDNLEKLISNKEYEQAALLYTKLSSGKFGYNELLKSKKEYIQSGLNNSNSKTAILNSEELNKIIQSNKNYFKKMFLETPQNIEIVFDTEGNGTINGSPTKLRNVSPFVLKEVGSFKVYCKSIGSFQLSTEQIQNPNKLYFDIWVSPNQKISKKGNKYFKKTFLSASIFKDEVSVINDNQVPYGKYWIVKHELKLFKVNDINIHTDELLVKQSEDDLSKRFWVKIGRGTGLLASVSWLTLRIIEYSSVK